MVLLHVESQPMFSESHIFSVTAVRSLLPNMTLEGLSNIYLLQLWNKSIVLLEWGLIHQRGDRKVFWGLCHTISLVWAVGCLSPRQTPALPKHCTPGVQGYPRGNRHAMVGCQFWPFFSHKSTPLALHMKVKMSLQLVPNSYESGDLFCQQLSKLRSKEA